MAPLTGPGWRRWGLAGPGNRIAWRDQESCPCENYFFSRSSQSSRYLRFQSIRKR
jgi:hypothetical protein